MRRENGSATESSEDYLEVIFVIRQESGRCRNVDIAERMGVTKPSVTKALARLSAQSLVKVVGRDVRLTQKGLGVARATLDKHEFLKRLLCDAGVARRPGRRAEWSTACRRIPSSVSRHILGTGGTRATADKQRVACESGWRP